MTSQKLLLATLLTSILAASCQSAKFSLPKEPKLAYAWRTEKQSPLCNINPIELAEICAKNGTVPNADWVYFSDNSEDYLDLVYYSNWRKDTVRVGKDEGKEFIVVNFMNLSEYWDYGREETAFNVTVSKLRYDCPHQGKVVEYERKDGWSKTYEWVESDPEDNPVYREVQYMCNDSKE